MVNEDRAWYLRRNKMLEDQLTAVTTNALSVESTTTTIESCYRLLRNDI